MAQHPISRTSFTSIQDGALLLRPDQKPEQISTVALPRAPPPPPNDAVQKPFEGLMVDGCNCGPDFYSRFLGPSLDETILDALMTVGDFWSSLRVCHPTAPVHHEAKPPQVEAKEISKVLQSVGLIPEIADNLAKASMAALQMQSAVIQTSSPELRSNFMQTSQAMFRSGMMQTSPVNSDVVIRKTSSKPPSIPMIPEEEKPEEPPPKKPEPKRCRCCKCTSTSTLSLEELPKKGCLCYDKRVRRCHCGPKSSKSITFDESSTASLAKGDVDAFYALPERMPKKCQCQQNIVRTTSKVYYF